MYYMYIIVYTCISVIILFMEVSLYMSMRDEKEGRKKVKQTTRQSNTAHPRQSLFPMYIVHNYKDLIHVRI